jgi:hypothetical protein
VPLAFADAQDPALKAEFAQTNAAVIAALNELSRLAEDRPAGAVERRLPHRRGCVPEEACIRRDGGPAARQAAGDWLGRSAQEPGALQAGCAKNWSRTRNRARCLRSWARIIPRPIIAGRFRATFDGLVSFHSRHHIVTIPSDVRPIVEETPPFMRATTFASMDTPGPFETHATEAYFNVTLPDPKMTPAEVEGYMHSFNMGTVISTAVHEAYPGHYIQFLWLPQAPSRVRKLLGANTDVEGWAHYCEQMMLDEGYGQPGAGAKG